MWEKSIHKKTKKTYFQLQFTNDEKSPAHFLSWNPWLFSHHKHRIQNLNIASNVYLKKKQQIDYNNYTWNYIRPIWLNYYCYVQYCTKKRVYLCNVQHCIYKVHLNTGFSSNTETTINRFDVAAFFFSPLSLFVCKRTRKCIINNINSRHLNKTKTETTPTQLVHTQAKLFKCTMIDSRSERLPAPL